MPSDHDDCNIKPLFAILYGRGMYGTPHRGTALNIGIGDFDNLVEFLRSASTEPRHPSTKDQHEWFSPVILNHDAETRTLTDINYMSPFICLDIDAPGW